MKLLIDVEKDYFEMIKYNVACGEKYKPFEIIADGIPYEDKPQGEWIIKPKENSQSAILICNKCNHFIPITIDKNYCPNCGADMRGKEE